VAAPQVVTPEGTVIEDGGGVIVQATGIPDKDKDAANQPGWRFVAAGKRLAPVIAPLAPGLAVYVLPQSTDDNLVLESDKHEREISIRRSSTRDAARLPMPVVASIDSLEDSSMPRFATATTTVHFPTPAPKGAFAVVIYGVDHHGDRTAYSFGTVREGDRDVVVYHSGHCTFLPTGTKMPAAGEPVAVAWIDKSGRVSAPSKEIDVVTAKGSK
jgi:hypothetical protein